MTQDERVKIIAAALWISAKYYTVEEGTLCATIDVENTASMIIAMLDDLEMIAKLPNE